MGELEKINIYVPERVGDVLDRDARMFEIYKRDMATINKNRFLSMLIAGYYDTYTEECLKRREQIGAVLDNHHIDKDEAQCLVSELMDAAVYPEIPARKGRHPVHLSYKPTSATEPVIMAVMSRLHNEYLSQYFCRMFTSYSQEAFCRRERIIFKESFEFLQKACANKQTITFSSLWYPQDVHTVLPYKLSVGKEEMYNYLLCGEINSSTGKMEASTYRINRIIGMRYSPEHLELDKCTGQSLDMMHRLAPPYKIEDITEACVFMTDAGQLTYKQIYFGRPPYQRIEAYGNGYKYYFRCSLDQLFLYFKRFRSSEAVVISPPSLREQIIQFHRDALDGYGETI